MSCDRSSKAYSRTGQSNDHSHDQLQSVVAQAASFNLFCIPGPSVARHSIYAAGNSGKVIGFRSGQTVHRFDIELDLPTLDAGVCAKNLLGPAAGRFDFRWMIAPREFLARPDREPPPTSFDPSRSQRIIMQEAVFTFGDGRDGLRSFGSGRTFPMPRDRGPGQLPIAAVGIFTESFGRLRGCDGNFSVNGELSANGDFVGNIMIRILDFGRALRTAQDLSAVEMARSPDTNATFLTWIAQNSKTPEQENTFSLTPERQVRGFNISLALKRVQVSFAPAGPRGLNILDLRTGEVIGREIGFGRKSGEHTSIGGTPLTPFQFEGVSRYTFHDLDGHPVGALTANVLEGRSIRMQLPGIESESALRLGYFGPIVQGSGCFAGAHGFVCGTGGLISARPRADQVISNICVARIIDPEGRFQTSIVHRPMPSLNLTPSVATSASGDVSAPSSMPGRRPAPAMSSQGRPEFLELVRKTEAHTKDYKKWREAFKNCSGPFSKAVAAKYFELRNAGDFPDLAIDGDGLKTIFEAPIKPFDPVTFERYQGPAKGVFTFYDMKTQKQVSASTLYSYWDYKTLMHGERHYKQIAGSELGYYEPDKIPQLSERKVDIIANSYRSDVGVCSFVDIYQHVRQQRTSFAYKLPNPHEVLWFVKDLFLNDQDLRDNRIFMASHEWKGTLEGKTAFFMVGIFFKVDFDTCGIEVSGDQFWRGLYIAESNESGNEHIAQKQKGVREA